FAGTFTHTSKHRVTRVHFGDVVDQLLDKHGFTHACTTEQTDLTTLGIGGEKVDDLDAGDENNALGRLVDEFGGGLVDGAHFSRHNRTLFVDRLADDVQDAAQRTVTDGHRDRRAGVGHRSAAHEAF